jgi:O-antigen/teichoic acid export membrane protein
MSRLKRLIKEGGYIVAGQITTIIGTLLLVRILTEYLNQDEYGRLALTLTIAGLVSQVVLGGLIAGIGRFYSIATQQDDLVGYLQATKRVMGFATLVVIAIAIVLTFFLWCLEYIELIGLCFVVLIFSVLNGYKGALSAIQNAARQRAIVAVHAGLDSWLSIILVLGLISLFGATSITVITGYIFSSALVVISQLVFIRKRVSPHHESSLKEMSWVRQIWAFSFPFSIWGIFSWMHLISDRWALKAYSGLDDVGQYAVLFQLGYAPIAMISGLLMGFIGPILYQRSGDITDHARNASVHSLSWQMAFFTLGCTAIGFLLSLTLHRYIFGLLVAVEYRAISYLLPWIVLAGGIFSAGQILSLKLMSEMRSNALVIVKIVTALLGVSCNIFGAMYAGVDGVVAAQCVFSIIYIAWMALIAQKIVKIKK